LGLKYMSFVREQVKQSFGKNTCSMPVMIKL
jgi:hypothetical protein